MRILRWIWFEWKSDHIPFSRTSLDNEVSEEIICYHLPSTTKYRCQHPPYDRLRIPLSVLFRISDIFSRLLPTLRLILELKFIRSYFSIFGIRATKIWITHSPKFSIEWAITIRSEILGSPAKSTYLLPPQRSLSTPNNAYCRSLICSLISKMFSSVFPALGDDLDRYYILPGIEVGYC